MQSITSNFPKSDEVVISVQTFFHSLTVIRSISCHVDGGWKSELPKHFQRISHGKALASKKLNSITHETFTEGE